MVRVKGFRSISAVAAIFVVAQAPSQPQPYWSDQELASISKYWSVEGRYSSEPAGEPGAEWVVRATPAGSKWIREVYKQLQAGKVVPTQDPTGDTPEQKAWTSWLDRQVARDWADAELKARALNAGQTSEGGGQPAKAVLPKTNLDRKVGLDKVDRGPGPTPPAQDPCPDSLVALVGPPPRFSAPVRPMRHTITFEDGLALSYIDNVKLRAKYAYYRFAEGVNSGGQSVKTLPDFQLASYFKDAGISGKEQRVMKAVSLLEGGFDSVNTYDTGYVSVGFIQFACLADGSGSLGKMMSWYKESNPSGFARDFERYGVGVDGTRLVALDLENWEEKYGSDAALQIIRDKRLIAVFQRAGRKSKEFCVAQLQAARKQFYPGDDMIAVTLGGSSCSVRLADVFRTEAGLATLMDRKVNTGKLGGIKECIESCAAQYGITKPSDLCDLEYVLIQQMAYRVDYTTTALAKPRDNTVELSRRGSRLGRKGG